ncbi:MAG: hypothetical protein AAFV33_16450 [Chloroflexota bacterium]
MKTIPEDANPPIRLLMSASRVFGQPQPEWIVQAPGREMWIAGAPIDDATFTIEAEDFDGSTTFTHRSAKSQQTIRKRPLPVWARYPAGVVAYLGDGGMAIPGFHIVLLGDEPAGPRYTFGLGLVTAAFCHAITDSDYTERKLMDVVEQVRRKYVDRG